MKTLVTGDLSFSENPRDDYRHRFFEQQMPELIRHHKVDRLLILGDITEAKNYHSDVLVNRVVDHFYALAELAHVVIIPGNHDYVRVESPFFLFLNRLENITWIGTPTNTQAGPDQLWMFLPHTADHARDWKDVDFRGVDYVFAHQTFEGALSNGFRLEGVPTSIFPKGVKIVSGDVHKPQTVGPVTYVGSPYTVDFGDDFQPRVVLLDHKGKFESLDVDGPQKCLIEIRQSELDEQLKRYADCGLAKGDLLKVRIKISTLDQWPQTKAKVLDWANRHGFVLSPTLVQPVASAQRSMSRIADKAVSQTDEQIVMAWATATNTDDATLKTGLWLLGKA